jgi:hypothetical protein
MALAPSIIINLPGYPFTNLNSTASIAALRALASTALVDGQNIAVDGGLSIGDGGGGLYTWSDLSVVADNGKSVIKPNDTAPLAAGRWVLTGSPPQSVFDDRTSLSNASVAVYFDGSMWAVKDYAALTALTIADTAQGIYVRSTVDLTKVWVRQFSGPVQLQWFGFASANADNSPNFVSLFSYIRAGGVQSVEAINLGLLQWNGGTCFGGISDVDIAYENWFVRGTQFRNLYNWTVSGYQFDKMSHWPVTRKDAVDILKLSLNTVGRFIENVAVGAGGVTFKTVGNPVYTLPYAYPADNFVVGGWAVVASVNNQPGPTYPQCLNNIDIVKIKTITGFGMTFEEPLRYQHLTTSVDMWSSTWAPGVVPSGKARVWALEQFDKWDFERVFDGLDLVFTPFPYSGPQAYINFWGRKVTYRNCKLPGFGMSLTDEYILEDCDIYFNGEGDKINRKIIALRTKFRDSFNITNSGCEDFYAEDCRFFKGTKSFGIDSLSAKKAYLKKCYIEGLNARTGLGLSGSKTFEQCNITALDNEGFNYFTDQAYPISGGITYANGVFTIPFADAAANIAATTTLQYACVEGAQINFAGVADVFTGDAFSGRVLSVTETGAAGSPNYVITTDMPFAAIPTALLGIGAGVPKIRIQRDADLNFIDCYGCNAVRVASEGYKLGYKPWQYRSATYMGKCAQVTSMFSIGKIAKIIVEVIKPKATAGALNLTIQSYNSEDFGIAVKSMALGFDLTIKGKRSYDLLALTGKQASDTATFDGGAITALTANRWTNQNHFAVFGYDPTALAPKDLPEVKVTIITDTGQARELPTTWKDPGGNLVAAISGGLM